MLIPNSKSELTRDENGSLTITDGDSNVRGLGIAIPATMTFFAAMSMVSNSLKEEFLLDKSPPESIVDKVVNNPAYELLGGYQLFLRVTIPILLVLILLLYYTLFSSFISSDNATILAFGFTGLLLGPVLNLDRLLAEWLK